MVRTITMGIHNRTDWDSMGLDSVLENAIDGAESRNVRPDGFEVEAGDMFAVSEDVTLDDGKRYHVIFNTTFCNYWAPWTSDSTHATVYEVADADDVAEFKDDLVKWESKPEYDPKYESSDDEESDDDFQDIDGPTALVVQKFGAVRKEYGPFPVTIGPNFDECGLDRSVLKEVTRAARMEGAETGYCDIIIHDADGNELDTETAVI